jgi:predicted nuclease of restriction endonuclease-like (RecB) superfamily
MSLPAHDAAFAEVAQIIASARRRAMQSVNTALIDLYWQVGEYISRKIESAEWGDAVVPQLADYIARSQPGLRGFTRSNLFRMRQFYEAYQEDEIVAALLRQLSWTHHLIILGQSRHPEERAFYLRMTAQEKWSSRELERQFKAALFERSVLQPPKVAAALRQNQPEAQGVFRDMYLVDFLKLPDGHNEADLHLGLVRQLN